MTAASQRINDQFCVFRSDGATWAVSATSVREVTDMVPLVTVPESSRALLGVCHLRNEFLPVLDLRAFQGDEALLRSQANVLLVLQSEEGPWALPIERAVGLEALEVAIRDTGKYGDPASGATLGTATYRDEIVRVIDARRMYRIAAYELEHHWNGPHRSSEHVHPATPALI